VGRCVGHMCVVVAQTYVYTCRGARSAHLLEQPHEDGRALGAAGRAGQRRVALGVAACRAYMGVGDQSINVRVRTAARQANEGELTAR